MIVTKGPGVLNCVGALATAMYDTSAVMVICGGGPTHHLGKSMQELTQHGFEDVVNLMRPVVKRAWFQVRPDTVMDTLNQAYKIATTGRPGPGVRPAPARRGARRGRGRDPDPQDGHVADAPRRTTASTRSSDLLEQAERPFLLAGGGIAHSPGRPSSAQGVRRGDPYPDRDHASGQRRDLRGASSVHGPGRAIGKRRRGRDLAPGRPRARHRRAIR